MSQPAVSTQLKLLEEEYRTQFYKRTNHGVEITEQGRAFLLAVRPILAQIDKLEIEFKIRSRPKRPEGLTVAANDTLSSIIFPRAMDKFSTRHPNVQLVLEIMRSDAIERLVMDGKVEVALITRPTNAPNIIYEPYEEYETVAFVQKSSELSNRLMSLEQLTEHPLVVKKSCPCVRELRKRGFNLRLSLQCNAREAVKTAVRRGLGVGILFSAPRDSDIVKDDMRIIDVPELKDIKHYSYIVYGRRNRLSTVAQDFIDTLHSMRNLPEMSLS